MESMHPICYIIIGIVRTIWHHSTLASNWLPIHVPTGSSLGRDDIHEWLLINTKKTS